MREKKKRWSETTAIFLSGPEVVIENRLNGRYALTGLRVRTSGFGLHLVRQKMITEEGMRLSQHWDRIGPRELDRYLIQDVEHPAYNPQSVLIRAFIIDRMFPREAMQIIEAELYYSACASFALCANREGWFAPLYHTLMHGSAGYELPPFLRKKYRDRFSSYFDVSDLFDQLAICLAVGFDNFSSPFEEIWRNFLKGRQFRRCHLVELGCGSANDYRMWSACGVSSLLEYTGIDVSKANIGNAQRRFHDETFLVDDICSIDAGNQSFDVTVVFDVYEHLSPSSLSTALNESLRITRDECWMSFFNAADIPQHTFREVDDYHWNVLSISMLEEEVRATGFDVEIYSVPEILETRFDGYRHYNREAHILAATRKRTNAKQKRGEV